MKSITEWIDHYIKLFPQMTKEESDAIENILKWEDDRKAGFMMAKRLFEDEE